MRRLALGIACLVVTAGCLAASAQTESAMSLEETARDRADDELEDPRLVGLWGVETPEEVTGENSTLRVHLDDDPGDGNAAGWAFRFVGQQRTAIVVVGDEVGVIAEFYTDLDEDDDPPETLTWEVDSEEAADTLKANETWPEMTPAHALSWGLEHDDNRTVWDVEAREVNLSGHDVEHHALVDAETGEILEIREEDEGFYVAPDTSGGDERPSQAKGGCDRDADSGQVSPTDELEAQAELAEPGRIAVSFNYGGAGPIDLTLSHEGDTVWEETITAAGGDNYEHTIDDLPAGDYTLTASTDAGAVSGTLEIAAQWGHGGACAGSYDYGPTGDASADALPAWVQADRTLGVATLG